MKQDLCLCLTLLLLVCISVSRSGRFQVVGPADRVVAVAGEDVVLPCYLKPNISAEALVVRWFKQDVVRPVHLYANKRNNEDKQDASYVGRTQLFREELKAGNTSLKLFRVRVSDNGRYNCFVHDEPKNEYDDISIQLLVKAIGKQPVISIEGHRERGVGLLCESAGWYPQPELIWRDGEGHNLTAGPTETDRDSMDLFIVRRRLIVHKGTSKLTCRVLLQQFRQERDTEVHIPDEIFPTEHWEVGFGVFVVLFVIAVLAVVFFWKKKGQLEAQKTEREAQMGQLEAQKSKFEAEKGKFEERKRELEVQNAALTGHASKLKEENSKREAQNAKLIREKDELIAQMAGERVVRVILLGEWTEVTRMTGNCILGRDYEDRELERCKAELGVVDSKLVTMVMTPGWRGNEVTPEEVRLEISRSVQKCPPGPHAILLVVPWERVLRDGYDWSKVREHAELLGGARVWAHTLVIFCCWVERHRRPLEEKGKQLRLVREECGGRCHVLNVNNRGGAQVTELLDKIMTMVKGHGGGYFVPEAETNSEDSVRPEAGRSFVHEAETNSEDSVRPEARQSFVPEAETNSEDSVRPEARQSFVPEAETNSEDSVRPEARRSFVPEAETNSEDSDRPEARQSFVPEAETNSEDSVRPEDEEERAESTALIGGEVK